MGFVAYYEEEQRLEGDRVWIVIMGEFCMGN